MRTRLSRLLLIGLLSVVVIGIGSACATPGGRIYVRVGPPVPLVEVRAAAPGPHFVWIEGHHHWNGSVYAWVPGRWVAPPRPRAVWVTGRWAHDRHGWYYIEGHWR